MGEGGGTLCHIFWDFSRIDLFWNLVQNVTVARYLKAAFWKWSVPPSSMDLDLRIKEIRSMEYLTVSLNNKLDHFNSNWSSLWDQYSMEHNRFLALHY